MNNKEQALLQACRQGAKASLRTRGRWLRLVLYAILFMFLLMLPFAVSLNVVNILYATPLWVDGVFFETVLPYLLMIPTFFLVTCPYTASVMRGVVSTVTDERRMPQTKMHYGRDLTIGLCMLARVCLPPVLVLVAWCLPSGWFDEGTLWGPLIGALLACVTFGGMLLWFLLSRRGFFVPYLTACGYSPREARRRSRAMVASDPSLPMTYVFSFFGLVVLSVLSLGVLYILWVLPLMWATYVRAASLLQNKQSHVGSNE